MSPRICTLLGTIVTVFFTMASFAESNPPRNCDGHDCWCYEPPATVLCACEYVNTTYNQVNLNVASISSNGTITSHVLAKFYNMLTCENAIKTNPGCQGRSPN